MVELLERIFPLGRIDSGQDHTWISFRSHLVVIKLGHGI